MGLFTTPLSRRARRHFDGLTVLRESDANSFGVESLGPRQVRGNGTLALTADELLFAQWIPNRLFRIRRGWIIDVTTPRSHLGKTMVSRLLKVTWTTESGSTDSIALLVKDLDAWIESLG